MADLKSRKLIVLKGLLFLLLIVLTAGTLFRWAPSWKTLVLLAVLIWASARFYYFLFYVLHAYVDSRYKYSGLVALLKTLGRNRHTGDK